MEYIGEHTLPGIIGNTSLVVAFALGLYATLLSVLTALKPQKYGENLLSAARLAFVGQGLGIATASAALFYIIFNGYFEYDYAWKHSNSQMDMKYILACFWEGYEGSFLLWMFWQALLGLFLFKRAGKFEPWALAVFSFVQCILLTMVLGVYLGEWRVGSNPFILIRELPDNVGLPWTYLSDYLEKIPQFADGRGLNPLLQNYWMTIHPPIIFLGYSACLIPFAYAFSGLMQGDYRGWIKPAMPLTLAALGILGIGILMGGAWAYEALSFGGFWAWDPVENASLVPWLLLVGTVHLMALNSKKKSHVFSMMFFALATYALVVYATFLTKSGVLGESSVHSFTDNGMSGQLMVFLAITFILLVFALLQEKAKRLMFSAFVAVVLVLGFVVKDTAAVILFMTIGLLLFTLLARQSPAYKLEQDDSFLSREFWMFVGALVLFLSAMQITFSTSTPVYNILLKPFSPLFASLHQSTDIGFLQDLAKANFAPPADAIQHYNKWQVPFAILVTLLLAFVQFLKYKDTGFKAFAKSLILPILFSGVTTLALALLFEFTAQEIALLLLLFAGSFGLFGNLWYMLAKLKWNWSKAGASLSHIGFSLIILGSLISTGKSKKISENTSGIDITALGEKFENNEDILLFKGDTLAMQDYFIHYKDNFKEGVNVFYEVEYFSLEEHEYKKGDLVLSQGLIFRCLADHKPSTFLEDRERFWEYVTSPSPSQWSTAKNWNAYQAGEKAFSLYPRIQLNPTFGNVAEPATKHYLFKDVYTHVRWAELEEPKVDELGFLPAAEHKIAKGDTLYTSQNMVVLKDLRIVKDYEQYGLLSNDLAIAADLEITSREDSIYTSEPLFILRDSSLLVPDVAEVADLGLKFTFTEVNPKDGKVTLNVAEHQSNRRPFIVMQAIIFPGINILWLGCIIMAIGIFSSVYSYRRKKSKNKVASKGSKAA